MKPDNKIRRWLTIDPNVFISKDVNSVLFYNSESNTSFETPVNDFMLKLYDHMNELINLNCMEIEDFTYNYYGDLFKKLCDYNISHISYSSYINRKVSLPSIYKLHYDHKRIRRDYENRESGRLMNFLNEITVYLNGDSQEVLNSSLNKQFYYPFLRGQTISVNGINAFFEKIKYTMILNINIVFDLNFIDIFENLFNILSRCDFNINFYLRNKPSSSGALQRISDIGRINIICNADESILLNEHHHIFLVSNLNDIDLIESKKDLLQSYEVIPIYQELFKEFFKENIFTKTSELRNLNLSKRLIFANKILDTNFFGKLTIIPNGKVLSNINFEPIGTIKTPIENLVFQALSPSESWLLTREVVQPCKDCRYRFICPPISNYELYLEKFNLCDYETFG